MLRNYFTIALRNLSRQLLYKMIVSNLYIIGPSNYDILGYHPVLLKSQLKTRKTERYSRLLDICQKSMESIAKSQTAFF
jgi:hypothetical protein